MKLEQNLLIINMINTNITTPEFNKLTVEDFAARLKQANLVAEVDFDDRLKSLDQKLKQSKTFSSSKLIKKAESIWLKLF